MEVRSNKKYHPQMHSAEHILNQTMVRMFNCGRSVNNHIEKKKSKCDYKFDRNLTSEEIEDLNKKVNDVIQMNLLVREEFYVADEARKIFNLSKLPADTAGPIRIIKIGGYDACPCSGLHVNHTKEIGRFNVSSTDYNDGILRIRFKLLDE